MISVFVPLKPPTLDDGLRRVFRVTIVRTRLLAQQEACPFSRNHFLHVAAEVTQSRYHEADSLMASRIASATPKGLIRNTSNAFESRTTVGFFSPSIR